MEDKQRSNRIAELNDQLRTTFTGGQVYMTAGIAALPEAARAEVIAVVQRFNAFDEDNDPHGEHDCAVIRLRPGLTVIFKHDYYDARMKFASPDPSDPKVTKRVLTIMRSEEY